MPKSITVVLPDDTTWVAIGFEQVQQQTAAQVEAVEPSETVEPAADQTVENKADEQPASQQ